jgi:glycosyltransferase involved in cell wall biosynthesis
MKILIVSQYFWPEEFLINDFAAGLKQRGHQVEVLTGLPNYPRGAFYAGYGLFGPFYEEHQGISIWRSLVIPRGRGSGLQLAVNYLSFALFSSLRALSAFWRRFDAILVYQLSPVTVGIPARLLKKLHKGRLILWIQDLWPESLKATGGIRSLIILGIFGWLTRWIYRGCDRILIQSREFKNSVVSRGVDANKVHYLPNFAEDMFGPLPSGRADTGLSSMPKTFRILFAGNIGVSQDVESIVAAAEMTQGHRGIQWIIAGDGRRRSWLMKELSDRKLKNVLAPGRFPKEQIPALFANADLLLVSLKKDPLFSLTIPSKIQAYLACGKPVLASMDGEGARIIEEAQAGMTVPAENPERLAMAAITLSQLSPKMIQDMGRNGRKYYEKEFSRAHIIDEFEAAVLGTARDQE